MLLGIETDGERVGPVQWWWCLRHKTVEQGPGCPNMERLGPYDTEQEAAAAPDRTAARTAAEDARDEADDSWGTGWGDRPGSEKG
jgi:hypothetical protein